MGRIDGGAVASLPAEEPTALGRDAPAGWGHPWALGPLVELRASYADNRRQRDRVARQLLPGTRASIADEAQRSFERIVDRFEAARRESRFVPRAEVEPVVDSRRNRIRFPRVAVAAALGVAAVALAVEAKLDTGTSQGQTGIPTAVAGDLGRSLPVLSYRQPAGQRKNEERRAREPKAQRAAGPAGGDGPAPACPSAADRFSGPRGACARRAGRARAGPAASFRASRPAAPAFAQRRGWRRWRWRWRRWRPRLLAAAAGLQPATPRRRWRLSDPAIQNPARRHARGYRLGPGGRPQRACRQPANAVSPADGATLTARVDQVTFQAQATACSHHSSSFPNRMDFDISGRPGHRASLTAGWRVRSTTLRAGGVAIRRAPTPAVRGRTRTGPTSLGPTTGRPSTATASRAFPRLLQREPAANARRRSTAGAGQRRPARGRRFASGAADLLGPRRGRTHTAGRA